MHCAHPSPLSRLAVLALTFGALLCPLSTEPAAASPRPSNLARTRAELHRLKGDVRLPESSTRHAPVRRLREPADLPDGGRSLKDHAQYYRVHLSLSKVLHWAHRHPPRGSLSYTFEGTSGSTGGPPSEASIGFTGHDSGAYLQPTLEYSVVSGRRDFTLWRVDEMALWLDPRARVDRPGDNALRVTQATGCPRSDQGSHDVRNPGAGLDRHLVPDEAPQQVLVCTYSGTNGKAPLTLTGHRHAGPRRARALARAAGRISLAHLDGVVPRCPADTGAATVVDFTYSDRPDVDLWFQRTGCRHVANGHTLSGDATARTSFYARLGRLS